ncbi:MAG TPA: hypothetical protein VNA25_00300 [Phycisphaerae bacterium]|nr:hypothetical protein [Phycisphaerae bacterium]
MHMQSPFHSLPPLMILGSEPQIVRRTPATRWNQSRSISKVNGTRQIARRPG